MLNLENRILDIQAYIFLQINGEVVAEFGIFQNQDVSDEHSEKLNVLWEDFKDGYKDYIMSKFSK